VKFPSLEELSGDLDGGNDIECQGAIGLSCNVNRF
jgi:hypothetical protein